MYLKANEVMKKYNITKQTLYNWRLKNKISFIKMPSGSYLYEPLEKIEKKNKKSVIYARVSNSKQKQDLDNQISLLKQYAISNGNIIDKVYSDIGSGMNENRIEFCKLIDEILLGNIDKIFITFKDRLTRFGFGYLEYISEKNDCKIIIVDKTNESKELQQELTEDLISIIHHFSMKIYSNRRKKFKKIKEIIEEKDDEV
jgi:predicted site-specific integrase-resolvase